MTPSAPLTCPNAQTTTRNALPPTPVLMALTGSPFIKLMTVNPNETATMPKNPPWTRAEAKTGGAGVEQREGIHERPRWEVNVQLICQRRMKKALHTVP